MIARKLMNVHRLAEKEYWLGWVGAVVECTFGLLDRRAHFVVVPEFVGIELHQVVRRRKDLGEDGVVADYELIAVDSAQLLEAVYL
jgi:hypothetical protein